LLFLLFSIILILLIGLRYEVGGDWYRYLVVYSYLDAGSFIENFRGNDIAYEFLYWLSIRFFNNIYFVNLVSAAIFVFGLVRFCRTMPMPWLALLVSSPFLIVVVSMGYTRQAAAVGILMLALISLMKGKRFNFYALVILGALFHKTLIFMALIDFLYNRKKYGFLSIFSIISISIALYIVLLPYFEHLIYYYVTTKYHDSGGALVRVFMSTFAGIVFLIFRKRFKETFHDENLWLIFSLISIALLPLAIYYSTFTDRIAIYFIPLQLVVFSRIPILISSTNNRTLFVIAVIFLYLSVMFVWLNFANHAYVWLPYKNVLLT